MAVKNQHSYFHALYQLAVEVNTARTHDDALNLLAEITAKGMGAKGCSLMTITPDRKELLRAAVYGLSDQYVGKGPLSTDKSIAQTLEGRTVVVENAAEDERVQYPQQSRQERIASILSVPMLVKDKIIGVMRVYTGEPRNFTDDDMYFACAAANLGATAFENARMYEECQKSQNECQRSQRECRQKTRWLGQLLKEAAEGYEAACEKDGESFLERFHISLAGA
jgi:signal transduction protein with GAF and PtsI domain